MQIETILLEVRKHRPYSTNTFYRDALKLGIKPAIRQHPQNWPEDTLNRILLYRGFTIDIPGIPGGTMRVYQVDSKGKEIKKRNGNGRLATMPELRKERKKAGRK